jgi:hypothetical protein
MRRSPTAESHRYQIQTQTHTKYIARLPAGGAPQQEQLLQLKSIRPLEAKQLSDPQQPCQSAQQHHRFDGVWIG